MIKIFDFEKEHVEEAQKIALMNYNEERTLVLSLPKIDELPCLDDFAKENRGVAAMDGNELLGFFCWHKSWGNHFGLNKGTWSPVHAHGAVKHNRAEIYDTLYQHAAEKLVSSDVFSHSVTLYEHDIEANESFFQNGFGRRCVDAIRETTPITAPVCENIVFRQAGKDDADFLTMARNKTGIHLSGSPMFIPYSEESVEDTIKRIENENYFYFIALEDNRPVACYHIKKTGENFVADDASVMNICGAYALQEVRGKGVTSGLLSWLMDWLRERGYLYCGVDYECFNFTGRKFWSKYFTPYTNGTVRRIDERINKNPSFGIYG